MAARSKSDGPYDLKALCRLETLDNLRTLKRIRDSEDQPAAARLKAVEMMMDRAYGKPVQAVEVSTLPDDPTTWTRDELHRKAAEILAGIGSSDPSGDGRPN